MVSPDAGPEKESRPPTLEDLLSVCRELNRVAAQYVVIGGMAVIHHGFVRATEDIDLLLNPSAENIERVRQALSVLPDQAVLNVRDTDLEEYQVVRVADEIVVDLMSVACGVDYEEAKTQVLWSTVEGVPIPFASARLLWKLKQAPRAKDELDRMFLQRLLEEGDPELE